MIINKELVGKTIVLLPEHNAIERGKDLYGQAFEVEITAMRGKKLTYVRKAPPPEFLGIRSDYPVDVSFKNEPKPVVFSSELRSWAVFESWEAFNTYKTARLTRARLIDALTYKNPQVTDESLKQIAELLGWNDLLS